MNRCPLLAMLFFYLACAMRRRVFHDERDPTETGFDKRYLENRPPPDGYDEYRDAL